MEDLKSILEKYGIDTSTLDTIGNVHGHIFHGFVVDGSDAVSLWKQLRSLVELSGHWPLILGQRGEVPAKFESPQNSRIPNAEAAFRAIARMHEAKRERYEALKAEMAAKKWKSPQKRLEDELNLRVYASSYAPLPEVIAMGETLDAEQWLAQRSHEIDPQDGADDRPGKIDPNHRVSIPYHLSSDVPKQDVYLALVPTTVPWHVPVYLRYGGWNDCPDNVVQVCVWKRWHKLYGAEVIGMSRDVVEMVVARPPGDWGGAMSLAREQYLYCADIVDQGTETLANLAASLLGGTVWYFWWD